MRLNGHTVVKDLDIFDRVGHSTAHDEIVSFSIRRGKLSVQGEVSTFNGKLTVEFVKVSFYFFMNLNYLKKKKIICSSSSECQIADYTVTPVTALNDAFSCSLDLLIFLSNRVVRWNVTQGQISAAVLVILSMVAQLCGWFLVILAFQYTMR